MRKEKKKNNLNFSRSWPVDYAVCFLVLSILFLFGVFSILIFLFTLMSMARSDIAETFFIRDDIQH